MFAFVALLPIMVAVCCAQDDSIRLTENETAFLKDHPVIRLGVDPGFVPFEFIDRDGQYKSIASDYISLITERTGIQFEVVKGLTWPEAYDLAVSGDIDALPAISKTDEREQHFLFSEPYYQFKRVIVTRDMDTGISRIEDLEKSAVAVQRNSSHHSYLLSYPKINLSLYDSVEEALTAVANGTERAFVGNLATTNHLIRSIGLTNLRFTAFEAEKEQALHFAVRRDWPELVGILNKALDAITHEERMAIHNKWIDLGTQTDYGLLIRVVAIVCTLAAVAVSVSFYWVVRLRREINKRHLVQLDLEKARQEAVGANEFKSEFMARMSHEIRTPLNAITGLAYLLQRTEISPTQSLYIDRIEQTSRGMLGVINDILDFSKIEAGKMELENVSFSMDEVIQNVVNIVSYKIEEKEIGFRLSRDPEIPNWFFGDAKRIEQVLLNTLNNAVKFTSAGEVSLDVRLVARESDRYYLSLSIRDTGIGMTEEQIAKLFNPFVQGDSSIDRRFGGSGLGLSIVKSLVDMMGGQIQVFSTPGEDSTFVIHLSLVGDSEKQDIHARTVSADHFKDVRILVLEKSGSDMSLIESYLSPGSRSTADREASPTKLENTHAALLVEDNRTNQLIAKTLLEQAGIEPILAADGREAVELYRQHKNRIDLILMDLHTPVMNGYRAAQEIRMISGSVPIVAMTADVILGVQEKCEQSGIYRYISKPFDPDRFIDTVTEIIRESEGDEARSERVLDQSTGLRNLGGDSEAYRQVLSEFLRENQDTVDKLARAIQEERYAEAEQTVHKVKSSLGSIGAGVVYDEAVSLHRALSEENREDILRISREFTAFLKKLFKEITESQN